MSIWLVNFNAEAAGLCFGSYWAGKVSYYDHTRTFVVWNDEGLRLDVHVWFLTKLDLGRYL